MFKVVVILLPFLVFIQPASALDDASKLELKRLQGEWELVRSVREGQEVPQERLRGAIHTFDDDRWIPGRDPNDFSTISLDPDTKPKAITIKDKSGNEMLGIYKIEGETLTLCLARSGVARPKEFRSAEGSKTFLIEMKRRPK